eukprot:CAMPEP_0195306348 /NCGR_PEP_ID=MMETSP0707-20130614/37154_1 /TAXON_ID=33640 /ORGANISM="Asterionellopsis glacialis, Strain CCMP134" /LENGTH=518 /DNA_ID=CAMNT_0040370563 /DNA_START=122 /DNA_END=1678 /DNA_ORIENTATION=-
MRHAFRLSSKADLSSDAVSSSSTPEPKNTEATDTDDLKSRCATPIKKSETKGTIPLSENQKHRKMQLMWCGPEECRDVIRERVVGDHNHIEFVGPATGQVCYTWSDNNPLSDSNQDELDEDDSKEDEATSYSSVLLLVRPNDDELLKIAADSVKELTASGIQMLLAPDIAAKIKHYHGVDDENMIKLFEPREYPDFGNNLQCNKLEEVGFKSHNTYEGPDPDLICTLGGDGLLMHAGMMFPGPVPPILCIAGGSLGFLTPFGREEMSDTIQISLGFLQGDENDSGNDLTNYNSEMVPNHAPIRNDNEFGEGGYDAFHQRSEVDGKANIPKFSFGLGNRICLSMRMRLDCRVINRDGKLCARYNVLNEVVIDRGSSPYLAALECFCDDVHLTTVQADGIIFATPTGSTAYSMAAGGSVVHPAVPAILVTPICPHVLSFRSMVFPDHVVLRCFVPDDARSDASVSFDGKDRKLLHRGDSVQIQMSAHPVPTINRVDHSSDWLNSLKNNFNFNSRARQKPL